MRNPSGTPHKFPCKDVRYEIYSKNSCGPTFGGGHAFHLSDQCHANESSHDNLGGYYDASQCPNFSKNKFLVGSYHFRVSEYEVFAKL